MTRLPGFVIGFSCLLLVALGACRSAAPKAGNVRSLASRDFDEAVTKASLPVFVVFYAPWCHLCQALEPELERQSRPYVGKIIFYKVNLDQSPELARRYHIRGVPTLYFYRDGNLVDQHVGLPTPGELENILRKLAAESGSPGR